MIIKTRIVALWRAGATTIFPFILIHPKNYEMVKASRDDLEERRRERQLATLIEHEKIHYRQQKRWFVRGLGIGLPVWWVTYLVSKKFRRKAEMEAYREANGWDDARIADRLTRPPYNIPLD